MSSFDNAPITAWIDSHVKQNAAPPDLMEVARAQYDFDRSTISRLVRVIRIADEFICKGEEFAAHNVLEAALQIYGERKQTCVVCGHPEVDRAHIRSKGSGGTTERENMTLLCRQHHQQQHRMGWKSFCERHPTMLAELKSKGWNFVRESDVWKLRHEAEFTGG